MSAWIVGSIGLSVVADLIKSEEFKKYDPNNLWGYREGQDLVQKLRACNNENIERLYGDVEMFGADKPVYKHTEVSDVQRHKTVACYIYQCCDYCDDWEIIKALDKWCEHNDWLERHWDLAQWDIDNPRP